MSLHDQAEAGTGRIASPSPDDALELHVDRLAAYIAVQRPGLIHGRLRAELITGGRSNLTYAIADDGRWPWVLRRPPHGRLLDTANDITREYHVLKALEKTAVPTPGVVLRCLDTSVIGAPFYLMAKVDGTVYRRVEQLDAIGEQRTRQLCDTMIRVLASLHSLDPAAIGLDRFGHPDGYLLRQVSVWKRQLDASRIRPLKGIDELYKRLTAHPPAPGTTGIVHGDYRLDNLLFDERDEVAAVLDWEMATLGDPLMDIALLWAYSATAQDRNSPPRVTNGPAAKGYPEPDELVSIYLQARGLDADLAFYKGLACFKVAVILEIVHARRVLGHALGVADEDTSARAGSVIRLGLDAMAYL